MSPVRVGGRLGPDHCSRNRRAEIERDGRRSQTRNARRKVQVPPPLKLQPLPDPEVAPNESSVSPCAATGNSTRAHNQGEKDR